MDVKQTLAAINEFQNAYDRIRPFTDMLGKAQTLWEQLKTIDPDELQGKVDSISNLNAQIANLSGQRDQLQTTVNNLQAQHDARKAALDSDFAQKANDLAKAHEKEIEAAMHDLIRIQEQTTQIRAQNESMISEARAQHDRLAAQIKLMKDNAAAALHG